MTPTLLRYIRHLSKQDEKTLSQKALKTTEEVGELAKVILPYENAPSTRHRFVERERILEEAVDTALCSLSVAYDLDFTDEEVLEMMERKVEKWALLQRKEQDVVYPLPYEIHLTVQLPLDPELYSLAVPHFKLVCAELNCKAIVLDLESSTGETVMKDAMTSSKHYGDNKSAYEYASSLAVALTNRGHVVVRTKIETVPWHPMAPVGGELMPTGCYFEAHIPVTIPTDLIGDFRSGVDSLGMNTLHASRNVFKRVDETHVVLMLTLREVNMTRVSFEQKLNDIVDAIQSSWWTIGKVHTEFSVYDTKVSHDNQWILST